MPNYTGNPVRPEENEWFIYRGELLTREDLGNITFGYLGTAMGIPLSTIYAGGGMAQNTDFSGIISIINTFENTFSERETTYGDDPDDLVYVTKGNEQYRSDHQ